MSQENAQNERSGLRHEYVECQCSDPGHVFRIELDTWDKKSDPELSFTMQMNPHPGFFRRVYHAVRYVFGFNVNYNWGGHWDSVVLDRKAIDRLEKMLLAWKLITVLRRKRRKGIG
jgi:hypothetical protein